jgi:hypothetical protein
MDRDRNRDTADMDRDRNTDGQEQGHRQTGTQTDRTGTQMDRGRDTKGQGKGHKRTRTGIWTRTKTTLTGYLQKIRALKALSFKKYDKI